MSKNYVALSLLLFVVLSGCTSPPQSEIKTIGIAQWISSEAYNTNIQGFKDALAENGLIEGRDVRFITENAQTDKEKQREIIRSFVNKKVDLIYTLSTPGTLLAQGFTKEIPIVFSVVTYPVEVGLVQSLNSSGNNFVGTRNYVSPPLQYYTFERLYPYTKTLAFAHRRGEPNSAIQYAEFKKLLDARNIQIIDVSAVNLADLRLQLNTVRDQIDSIYLACDTMIQDGGEEVVIEFSLVYKKPTFSCLDSGVPKGALVSNFIDVYSMGKLSGEKAVLILKGAKPSWLKTESLPGTSIKINLETARKIGIKVPSDLLIDAEEIIGQKRYEN